MDDERQRRRTQVITFCLKKYSIDRRLIYVIRSLYNEATSAVALNGNVEDFFRMTGSMTKMPVISRTIENIPEKDNEEDLET